MAASQGVLPENTSAPGAVLAEGVCEQELPVMQAAKSKANNRKAIVIQVV